jgi:gluconate kinase
VKKFVIVLFGEMGSGKSYLGKKLADNMEVPFIEGDNYLPDDMREAVERFGRVTPEMVSHLVARLAIQARIWLFDHDGIVLSQALYREKDRLELNRLLKAAGFVVEWAYVKPGFRRNFKQLLRRPKRTRWVLYWLLSKFAFEPPRELPAVMLQTEVS